MAWPAGMFIVITFFVGADMAADLTDGVSFAHLAIETVALGLALAGAWGTSLQLRRSLARARALERHLMGTLGDLDRARAEAQSLRMGLSVALDSQFDRWGLTGAQREVALLVLKGLSFKEIADLRSTAEQTVRNQALAIYRKAGLTNRAEMAAFFLEDLLVPAPAHLAAPVGAEPATARTDGRAS
jgi:DNA-binding CsgD family transcriptional regulator